MTKNPEFTPQGNLTADFGAYDGGGMQYGLNGFFTGPVSERLAASLTASYTDTDGYLQNVANGNDDGDVKEYLVRGKLLFQANEDVKIVASLFHSDRKDYMTQAGTIYKNGTVGTQYPGSVWGTKAWDIAYDSPTPIYDTNTSGATLVGDFHFGAGTLTSTTGWTRVQAEANVDVDGTATTDAQCFAVFACVAYLTQFPEESVSQEFSFASEKMGRFSYVAGLFGFYSMAESWGGANGVFQYDTQVRTHAYAAFAEISYDLTDRLNVIGGLRYSDESRSAKGAIGAPFETDSSDLPEFSSKDFKSTSPRLSLRYSLNDASNVYFTYSEGFKSGVVGSNTYDVPFTDPEEIKSYEIGYKTGGSVFSLNAAAFYYDYKDMQIELFRGFTASPQNATSSEIYGLDVDTSWRPSDSFDMRLAFAYLPKAEFEEFPDAPAQGPPMTQFGWTSATPYDASGARVPKTPKLTASLTANYARPVGAGTLKLSGTVYHSDDYHWDFIERVVTDAYTLLNGEVSYSPGQGNWRAVLYGKNLTNEEYFTSTLLSSSADLVYHSAPRLFGARLEYSF